MIHLHVLLSEWLVGGSSVAVTGLCAAVTSVLSILTSEGRADNTLVGVGRFLGSNLLVGRLAGAAADGDEPEEAGSERESNAEPGNTQHLAAKRGLNVVWLQQSIEDTGKRGEHGGGGTNSGDDEDSLGLTIYVSSVISSLISSWGA